MAERNRMTPFGEIVAIEQRGLFMGNRGCIHRDRTIVRSWQVRRWITCALEFKGWVAPTWDPGRWTPLFFWDEGWPWRRGTGPVRSAALTVCPNSNVLIANKVGALSQHPFRRMREAGLLATLNTDDPAMTDLDLGKEYRSVAEALDLSFEDMAAVALDGLEATWLDDDEKRNLPQEFEREINALRVDAP